MSFQPSTTQLDRIANDLLNERPINFTNAHPLLSDDDAVHNSVRYELLHSISPQTRCNRRDQTTRPMSSLERTIYAQKLASSEPTNALVNPVDFAVHAIARPIRNHITDSQNRILTNDERHVELQLRKHLAAIANSINTESE